MDIQSFKQFARHKDGTYVSLEMDDQSKEMLDNFVAMNLGLEERVNPSTYHITIIYSRTPVPIAEKHPFTVNDTTPAVAKIIGYELFPTKNDGKCLVARIHCPEAINMNSWLSQRGATSDYLEYKPHITLAYDIQQDVDPSTMPLPQFPVTFNTINVAPLDPEYTPKNKDD